MTNNCARAHQQIMIKNWLIIGFIVGCQTDVYGQNRKTRAKIKPPPPPPKYAPLKTAEPAVKNEIEKFLLKNSPQAFVWYFDGTGRVPGGTLFKEYIELRPVNKYTEFSISARLKSARTTNSLELKKGARLEDLAIESELTFTDYSVKAEKDLLILTNEKTNEVERLKIFFDRNRKKIVKLQNLRNEMIYTPAEIELPTPMIVLPKRK